MTRIVFCFAVCLLSLNCFSQEYFVIDHRHTDLTQIPDNWIDSVQKNLDVRYYRRSHGSQVDLGGMTALRNYSTAWSEKYRFGSNDSESSLKLTTDYICVDYDSPEIYESVRTFLDNASNASTNVISLAWSYDFYLSDVQAYLDSMENLIRDYGPNGLYIQSGDREVPVTFVFQTACSHQIPERNELIHTGNELIREHCENNNRILFDFADIETYDPDGEYFGDKNSDGSYSGEHLLGDDASYDINGSTRGNWGIEWVNANPDTDLAKLSADDNCTSCKHSDGTSGSDNSRLQCVLKGCAAWWLFARLAGWDPNVSVTISTSVAISESNLDEASIALQLNNETFVDDNLSPGNFHLNNAPAGTSIESVQFESSEEATINLSFDGTDFDVDVTDFSITVLTAELTGSEDLTSNVLSIDAIDEEAAYATLSAESDINENNLNGAIVSITLSNESLASGCPSAEELTLCNVPEGVAIQSVNCTSDVEINVTLSFDGTDFDEDSINFYILIDATALTGGSELETNKMTIYADIESNVSRINTEVLKVYPNPVKQILNIDLHPSLIGNVKLIIIDLTGKTLFEKNYRTKEYKQKDKFDLSELPEGNYYLIFEQENNRWGIPLIKE